MVDVIVSAVASSAGSSQALAIASDAAPPAVQTTQGGGGGSRRSRETGNLQALLHKNQAALRAQIAEEDEMVLMLIQEFVEEMV